MASMVGIAEMLAVAGPRAGRFMVVIWLPRLFAQAWWPVAAAAGTIVGSVAILTGRLRLALMALGGAALAARYITTALGPSAAAAPGGTSKRPRAPRSARLTRVRTGQRRNVRVPGEPVVRFASCAPESVRGRHGHAINEASAGLRFRAFFHGREAGSREISIVAARPVAESPVTGTTTPKPVEAAQARMSGRTLSSNSRTNPIGV
jgi:hypothetical protein